MNKTIKIIFWIVTGAVIIIGAYLGYQYLKQPEKAPGSATLPPDDSEFLAPKSISENRIFDYWIHKPQEEIYSIGEDAKIYKITADGETQDTGSKAVGNLSYIKPSSDGSKIFIAFGYPRTPTFSVYSLNARTWQALPAGTVAAAWDPQSANRLVYLKDNGQTSQLNILDLSNNRSQTILNLSQKDLDLDWILPNLIYFKERPSSQTTSSIWAYDLKARIFKRVVRNESGLLIKWVVDGSLGLKLSGSSLSLVDKTNRELVSLGITTLPGKCAISNSLLYCAASDSEWDLDKYLRKVKIFLDNIYVIPLIGLSQSPRLVGVTIFDSLLSGSAIDAEHLEITKDRLLFINRLDNKLYGLEI